jgi:purine-cytosine permease-like protein
VLGFNGARMLALWLFVTNFAWIALNDVIAASIAVRLTGIGTTAAWAVGLGVVATLVVLSGPRGIAVADRLAVPLLVVSGLIFTVACLRLPWPAAAIAATPATTAATATSVLRALDVVTGYQVSWLLMFADYPRHVGSGRRAGLAVFGGLALAALWFMPLGVVASAIARSADPGAMVDAVGIGGWGAMLLILATLTTNFVNIYMSALAFKTLRPESGDRATVSLIGGIGAGLGMLSTVWLEQFANLVLLLAGAFVPIGGILLAHYVVLRQPVHLPDLYSEAGPYGRGRGWSPAGAAAWLAGALTFALAEPIGATLPSLAVAMAVYALALRRPGVAR